MDATEQFAAFALMGLLAKDNTDNRKVGEICDTAWAYGREMELRAMNHRRLLRESEKYQKPEPTEAPGGGK